MVEGRGPPATLLPCRPAPASQQGLYWAGRSLTPLPTPSAASESLAASPLPVSAEVLHLVEFPP